MIVLTTHASSGNVLHYVAAQNIARVTEAGVSSRWHGIQSVVRLFDGESLEVEERADWIAERITEEIGGTK